jgi:hypothetical protein
MAARRARMKRRKEEGSNEIPVGGIYQSVDTAKEVKLKMHQTHMMDSTVSVNGTVKSRKT